MQFVISNPTFKNPGPSVDVLSKMALYAQNILVGGTDDLVVKALITP